LSQLNTQCRARLVEQTCPLPSVSGVDQLERIQTLIVLRRSNTHAARMVPLCEKRNAGIESCTPYAAMASPGEPVINPGARLDTVAGDYWMPAFRACEENVIPGRRVAKRSGEPGIQ